MLNNTKTFGKYASNLQETKSDNISDMVIKNIWGNSIFEASVSEAIGNSGGLLCVWDPKVFHKEQQIISDNFIALYGTWTSNNIKMLLISVYAPQTASLKRSLWEYLSFIINRWNGECIVMGDFNEVRRKEDRWGGFDLMVTQTWNDIALTDNNGMIRFKNKLQILKKEMRTWIADRKKVQMDNVQNLRIKLREIDKSLDKGEVNDDLLASRMGLMNQFHDFKSSENRDCIKKAKVKWAVRGDENSKFFHGIVNRKRANLTVKGVADLENPISRDEIRSAVWGCGEDKSPGPDGFTFEFFRKFWGVIGPDFCTAQQAMIFKVDFAKAYDSVRWDYLDAILNSFGSGSKWRSWIREA
nr:RNA-directed DNA polymerase, eukaryota [Tanacetum cinerariifolium]